MINYWLKDQGLLSVKELWVNIHYPATPGNLCEPPGADPHAGWCGGWGRKTPGYKFKMCNLETTDARKVASPIIKPEGAITSVESSTSPPWTRPILTRIMIHPFIPRRITIPFILVKYWLVMKPTDMQTV